MAWVNVGDGIANPYLIASAIATTALLNAGPADNVPSSVTISATQSNIDSLQSFPAGTAITPR
jgi:hypothetical protein